MGKRHKRIKQLLELEEAKKKKHLCAGCVWLLTGKVCMFHHCVKQEGWTLVRYKTS